MAPPLFKRERSAGAGRAESVSMGQLPCSERGCLASAGLECAYVDRRDRACGTSWCQAHVVPMSGKPYCRRHAGVIRALPTMEPGMYPDLDNRAPSLLGWVTREIGPEIRELVLARAEAQHQLQESPGHLAFLQTGKNRMRSWEHTWKLVDHTGSHLWVSLDVEEDNELEILVRVDGVPVGRFIPPWIINRRSGTTPSEEMDLAQRRGFYDAVVAAVRQHLVTMFST